MPAPKERKTKAAATAASPAPDSEVGKQEPTRTNENKAPAAPHVLSSATEVAVTLKEYNRLLALGGISKRLRGINIQRPWAQLLLDGLKTVEARTYELKGYLNEDLWIIETPGKGRTRRSYIGVHGKVTL